jgi:hypothetical protein
MHAVAVTEEGGAPGLVDGDPAGNQVSHGIDDLLGVVPEELGRLARRPTALGLELLRQVPVVERDPRDDSTLVHALEELAIPRDAARVETAAPFRLQPGPGQREPVCRNTQVRDEVEVLAPARTMVARDVAVLAVAHASRLAGEHVPDACAPLVLPDPALDLVGRGGNPPDEVVGEIRGDAVGHRDVLPGPGGATPVTMPYLLTCL